MRYLATCGMWGLDWGSVPAWISALAVGVAVRTYYVSQRDRKQELAYQVGVWAQHAEQEGELKYQVVISNASQYPIFEAKVFDSKSRTVLMDVPVLLPGREQSSEAAIDKDSLVSADVPRDILVNVGDSITYTWKIELRTNPVEAEFRDARGARWCITSDRNKIKKLEARPPGKFQWSRTDKG
ncbi:hypothetical protein GCM10010193_09060 [Kitasatospora atroaurantiaca]|uniref:Uncharacterized protein n=1 Tax=Kitasatospora atroaurantiaca TaxID=285545 RepID=A0A561ERW7_9ACTN|nr:hypothetical protein [Kitasatospora atroaurantiaca]TWE18358.1 hypothetical protein FB465_3425 [Kitasatospora atroaurantiaca]